MPLRPKSVILTNEYITFLKNYFFTSTLDNVIHSIFAKLKHLTVIDCSQRDLQCMNNYIESLTQLESFHITIRNVDVYERQV